ncbi:MAG: hypothetical protein RL033_4122, partial [Pseudomonadota bacterium]
MSSVYDLDLRRKLSQLRVDPPQNGFDERLRERVRAALAQRAQEARLLELHQAPPPAPARPRNRRHLGVAALTFTLAAAAAALLTLGPEPASPQQGREPTARGVGTPAPAPQQPASTPPDGLAAPRLPVPATAPLVPATPQLPATTQVPATLPALPAPRVHSTTRAVPPAAPERVTVPRLSAAARASNSAATQAPRTAPPAATPAPSGTTPPLRAIPRVDISDPPNRQRSSAD